ncbi:MAG: hypothetical protein JO306_12310 [Gemmatimonadetes bacterium]|nr:hypothetical protein [Gemmatimonadota bacterium]
MFVSDGLISSIDFLDGNCFFNHMTNSNSNCVMRACPSAALRAGLRAP